MSENTIVQDGANLPGAWNDQSALDQSVFYPADMSALPTSTPNPSKLRRKSRRSWFENTPKGFKFDIAVEKPEIRETRRKSESVEVLTLTHFTAAPRLGFGTLKVGQQRTSTLLLRNPHDYEQRVRLEKVPEKKNFSVECKEFTVGPEESYPLDITWTPKEAGGCREMLLMQVDGAYRLQAYVFGTVTAPPPQKKKAKRTGLLASKASRPFSVIHTTSLANINHDYSPEKKTGIKSSKQTNSVVRKPGTQTNSVVRKPGTQTKGPSLQTQSRARIGTVTKSRKSDEARTRRRSARLSGKFVMNSKENAENVEPNVEAEQLSTSLEEKNKPSNERKAVLKRDEKNQRKKMRRSDTYSNVSGVGLTVPIIHGETVKGHKDTSVLNDCNISGVEVLSEPQPAVNVDNVDICKSLLHVPLGLAPKIGSELNAKNYDSEPSFLENLHQHPVSHGNSDEPSFLEAPEKITVHPELMDEPSFLQDPVTSVKANYENLEPSFLENLDQKMVKNPVLTGLQNIEKYDDSLETENQSLDDPSFLQSEIDKSSKPRRSLRKRSGIQEIEQDDQPTGVKLLRSAKRNKAKTVVSPETFLKENRIKDVQEHEADSEHKPLDDTVGQSSILEQLKHLKTYVHDKSVEIEKSGGESFHEADGNDLQRRETFVKQNISRFSMPGTEGNIRRGTFVTGPSKIKIIENQQPSEASPRRTTFTVLKQVEINKPVHQVDSTINAVLEEDENSTEGDEKMPCNVDNASKTSEDQCTVLESKGRMFSQDSLENESFEKQAKSPEQIFSETIEVFARRSTLTVTKSRPSNALLQQVQRTGAPNTCLFKKSETVITSIPEDTDLSGMNKTCSPLQKSSQNSTFEVPLEDSIIVRNSSFPSTPHCLLPNSPLLNDSRRSTHVVEKPKVVNLSKIGAKQLFITDEKTEEKLEVDSEKIEHNSKGIDKIDGAGQVDITSPPSANTRRRLSARRSVTKLRQSVETEKEVTTNLESDELHSNEHSEPRKSTTCDNVAEVYQKPSDNQQDESEEVKKIEKSAETEPENSDEAGQLFFIPLDSKPMLEAPTRPPVQRPNPNQFLKKRSNPVTQEVDRRCKRTKSDSVASSHQITEQKTFVSQQAPVKPGRVTRQSIKSTGSVNDVSRRNVLKPKSGAIKGLAQSKLILSKKSKSAVPKLPLAFAAKNMFYDERWMEKQERGFVNWLNFILTPADEHQGSYVKVKVDAGKLTLDAEKGRHRLAPTNEILSFRTYAAQRKLNRLRKSACRLFQSDAVRRVMQKLEAEVESNRLLVRKDKMLHADLGAKQKILDMLLSYNPLWLRIGLETIYGEMVPLQSNNDVYGLSRFIILRLLTSPDLAEEFAHPTVPHLYRDGYAEASAQHTLKKFLMLVYFLDQAKHNRLIDHNPCLFCKDSDIKASKDFLIQFSREFLSGEGDITKHLGYLGYKVVYSQTALDEFDFAVQKLAIDLRDGIRLTRVLEILCNRPELGKTLRAPAISRLQKIHNVELVFKELAKQKIDPGTVNARDVVDGHREKTLSLLWTIILQYQVAMVINLDQLKEEIQILERSLRLRQKFDKLINLNNGNSRRRESEDKDLHTQDERLNLLLKWCRAVCAFSNIKIENFTVSFSDGRALCHILHYYHPGLVPLADIQNETTMTHVEAMEKNQNLNCSLNDSVNSSAVFGEMEDPIVYEKLLANEKENFKLLSERVKELGGVPMMLRWSDMSNTIPDEKVVVTYLMYLCARLLDIRHESRAARVIQHAWKSYKLRKLQAELKEKSRVIVVLQRTVRGFLARRREMKRKSAAVTLQKHWRGRHARKAAERMRLDKAMEQQLHAVKLVQVAVKRYLYRRRFLKMKSAVIQLQAYCRGYLLRKRLNSAAACIQRTYRGYLARKYVRQMKEAAVAIQASFRGYLVRREVQKKCNAASIIQDKFRAYLEMKKQRADYQTVKKSCLTIQKAWREYVLMRSQKQDNASTKIQAYWKGFVARKHYSAVQRSVIRIQAVFRGHMQRLQFIRHVNASITIQRRFREYLVAKQHREDFLKLKNAAIYIQCQRRMVVRHREYCQLVKSAVKIQSYCRMVAQRRIYLKAQTAAHTIQKFFKAYQVSKACRKEFLVSKGAAMTIQAAFRGHLVRKEIHRQVKAAVVLQTGFRRFFVRRNFISMKTAALVCQSRFRAKLACKQQRDEYLTMRNAAIIIQKNFRGYLCKNSYKKTKDDILRVQSLVRAFLCRQRFMKLKSAALTIQKHYRAKQLGETCRRQYLITVGACITLQAGVRGLICRKQYKKMRDYIIKLQALIKGHLQWKNYQKQRTSCIKIQRRFREYLVAKQQRKDFIQMREAAAKIQAVVKMYLARKQYTELRQAVVSLQSKVRGSLQRKSFLRMKSAVQVLEKYYHAKILMDENRKQFFVCKGAAMTIQAYFRGHLVRQDIRKKAGAATLIQATYKSHVQRKHFCMLKNTVILCQRMYRSKILAKAVHAEYSCLRRSVVTLQSAFRGYKARKHYTETRQNVIKLQAAVRGYLQCRRYRTLQKSVITLQQRVRETLLARQQREKFLRLKHAATVIQSMWRMRLATWQYAGTRQAAIVIQSNVRCYLEQKKYHRLRSATVCIQRRLRASIMADQCRREFLIRKGAAMTVQAWYKGCCVQRKFCEQKRSAVLIQSWFRGCSQRQKFVNLKKSAMVFQRYYRAKLLGRQLQGQFEHARSSVIRLQAGVRKYLCRKEYLLKRRSVISLQSACKMYLARKSFQQQRQAAISIQQWFRGCLLMRNVRHSFLVQKGAAITIQAYIKMFLIRKLYLRTVEARRDQAAVKIQACVRGFIDRQRFARVRNAAVICQRFYRAKCLAIHERQNFIVMKQSAVTLQAHFRRLHHQRMFKKCRQSAVLIQSWYKTVRTRKQFVKSVNAAKTLQIYWRAELKCRQEVMQYQHLRDSAILIQSMYRGKIAREQYRKHKAVVKLQAATRMCLQRSKFRMLKKSAITIQSSIRSWLARRQLTRLREEYEQKRLKHLEAVTMAIRVNMAAIRIQRCYRNFKIMRVAKERLHSILLIQYWMRAKLDRLHYLHKRQQVIRLQSHVRVWLTKRDKAARVIQRAARVWLASAEERKKHRAALKFQTLWRGHCVRKKIKSRRLTLLRKRVKEATASATEDKKLGNRTSSALDFLLKYKQISEVLMALKCLDVSTRLSGVCCERMVETNAVSVLYKLLQCCNRSIPHMEIIMYTISILTNLAKYEKTRPALYETSGCADILVELMQIYREKGQIFIKTCTLLGIIALDSPCKMGILNDTKLVERLRSIHSLTSRKHKLEETQRVTRARMNASSMNATFMVKSPVKKHKIKPDWALHKDKMSDIQNPLKAINFVLGNLGIQGKSK